MQAFVTTVAVLAMGAAASAQTFNIQLEGSQEVPPVATLGTGTAKISLDVATGAISVEGIFTNLSSPATAAHIHGPAAAGAEAGILIGLHVTGGATGTLIGAGTLTPVQVTDLLAGLTYVNVHSVLFPEGEVRGQIVAPGSAKPYGSGNPPGSLALIGGAVKINNTVTLGIDNPLGTQSPGSVPFLGLSLGQDPGYLVTGAGTPLSGWGMAAPTGELLISVAVPNPFQTETGPLWVGPANPSPIVIPVPDELALVGWKVYAQGILIDPFGPQALGLTIGLVLDIGL